MTCTECNDRKIGIEQCPGCGTFHPGTVPCPDFFQRPIGPHDGSAHPLKQTFYCLICQGDHPYSLCTANHTEPKTEKPMDTERLKAANANRESLDATLRTTKGMESLPSIFHIASIDIRTQSGRTSLHHAKHTQLFKEQLELAYAGFRQAVMAISMAEAARLEEEFKNL